MTRYISEDYAEKRIAANEFGTRQLFRRPAPPGGHAIYAIEVFENDTPVVAGDEAFEWEIPEDLDGARFVKIEAYVNTVSSSGSVQLQIANEREAGGTVDLLTTLVTIEPNELNSKDAAAQPVIDEDEDIVQWGDHLRVDVDAAGSGTLGLGVILYFFPAALASIAITGAQGPPGGVTTWSGIWVGNSPPATGAWTTSTGYSTGDVVVHNGTFYRATANHTSGALTEPGVGANWETVWEIVTYTEGDAVSNNGTSYVAIVDHVATEDSEPGVGVDWEDFWMVLAERQQFTAVTINDFNQGRIIDPGQKAIVEFPFAAEIVSHVLLADVVGSLVLDLQKDTYANYPPTGADSIVGASPPTLSSASKAADTALVGWTTAIAAGDIITVHVDSVSFIHHFALTLKLRRL